MPENSPSPPLSPLQPAPSESILLWLDGSGPLVQAGLWRNGEWLSFKTPQEEAGHAIFHAADEMLREQKLRFGELDGFLFCEGPGSMLGIRIAAMAILGWQAAGNHPRPVYIHGSHALHAACLLEEGVTPPFAIISDARRGNWHLTRVSSDGAISSPQQAMAEDLARANGRFFRLEEARPSPSPVPAETAPRRFENHAALFLKRTVLRKSESPEPLRGQAPCYQKWIPERHR